MQRWRHRGPERTRRARATKLLDPDCNVPACECDYVQDIRRTLHESTQVLSIFSREDPIVSPAACRVPSGENVEVAGNTIDTSVNGISLVDLDRGTGAYGLYEVRNVWVHDNNVRLRAGGLTAAGLVGRATAFSAGNRFTGNRYTTVDSTGLWWEWQGPRTAAAWRSLGLDSAGTYAVG